ncbi:MAG: tetratricopeptide repeat protein [Planctomycetota bacterium]|nr:tetratricopeptide repeat protein [Planctomycetota bacterium]
MARRVNTKFLGILLIGFLAAAGLVYVAQALLIHDHPDRWIAAGDLAMRQEQWNDAVADFMRAASLSPRDPDIQVKLGQAYHHRAQTDPQSYLAERTAYQRALEINPTHATAISDLIEWYKIFLPVQPSAVLYRDAIDLARRAHAINPQDVKIAALPDQLVVQEWAAGLETDDQQVQDAVTDLTRLMNQDPTNADLPFTIARVDIEHGQRIARQETSRDQPVGATKYYVDAVSVFQKVLGQDGDGPQINNAMMHCRFAQVLDFLSDVDLSDPGNHQKYLQMAAAENDRARALIKENDEFYMYVNLAAATYAQRHNDNATAIRIYRALPDNPSTRVQLADVLSRSSDTRAEAEQLMERTIASLGDDPNRLAGARLSLMAQLTDMRISDFGDPGTDPAKKRELGQEIQDALDKINAAVGTHQANDLRRVEAHFKIAGGRYEEVIIDLQKLMSDDASAAKDEALLMMLASALDHAHQSSRAMAVLGNIVDLYPRDVRALKEYVRLLQHENPPLAKINLDRLDLIDAGDPDLPLYHINQGVSDRIQNKTIDDPSQAKDYYSKLAEDTTDQMRSKAHVAAVLHEWDESIRLLNKVISLEPKDAETYLNLSRIFLQIDKKPEAMDAAKRGLAVSPDNYGLKLWSATLQGADPEVIRKIKEEGIRANPDKFEAELEEASLCADHGDAEGQEKHLHAAEKLQPNSPRVWGALFDYLIAAGRLDEAEVYLPRLSTANYDSAGGALFQMNLAKARGDYPTAMQIAQKLIQDQPEFGACYVAIGDVLVAQQQYDQAKVQYAIGLQKQSNNALAYLGLAKCAYAQKHPEEALKWITDGLAKSPTNNALKQMLVVHKMNYGNPQDAIASLEQEIANSPSTPGLYSALADCYLRIAYNQKMAGNEDDCNKTIEQSIAKLNLALKKWPDDAPLYLSLADAEFALKHNDVAEQVLHTWAIRDTWKKSPDPHVKLAEYYQMVGKPDQAEVELETAMAISNNRVELEVAVSDLLESHKKYEDALKILRTVNADNPTIQAKTIEVMQYAGHLDEAQEQIKTYLAKKPPNAQVLLTLWAGLLLNRQQYNDAAARATEALALAPTDPNALYCRARARLRTTPADPQGALDDLHIVVQALPNDPQVGLDLAAAYLQLDKVDEATSELQGALRLDPTNKKARMMLVQIYQGEDVPRLAEALATLHDIETTPPFDTDPDIFQSEAMLLSAQGNLDKALQMSAKALRLNPNDPLLFKSNLELLLKASKFQDVLTRTSKLPAVSQSKWWILQSKSEAERGLNDMENAQADMIKALDAAHQTKDDDGFAKVADALSKDFGLDAAIAAVRPYMATSLRAKLSLAVLYHTKGDDLNAVASVDDAMTGVDGLSKPDQIITLTTAAQLYQTAAPTPLVDKSYAAYLKWLALDPNNVTALNNFAWLLSDQYVPSRSQEALKYIQRAVDELSKTGRQEPKLMDTHGWLLVQTGSIAEGIRVLDQVLELKPFPEAYLHIGEAHLLMQFPEESKHDAQTGLDMLSKQAPEAKDSTVRQKLLDLAKRADEKMKANKEVTAQ